MAESSLVVVLAGDWTSKKVPRTKSSCRNVLWPEVLEQSPVVSNRLLEHGLSHSDSQSEASANCVMAIVEVSPGTCYTSPLTQWDKEEKILFQFWNHPVDMYSMRVRRVCRAITHEHLLSETWDNFRGCFSDQRLYRPMSSAVDSLLQKPSMKFQLYYRNILPLQVMT